MRCSRGNVFINNLNVNNMNTKEAIRILKGSRTNVAPDRDATVFCVDQADSNRREKVAADTLHKAGMLKLVRHGSARSLKKELNYKLYRLV